MAQENEKTEHVTKIIVQNNMSNALGIASFIFGLISIFFLAPVFVPLALLLGIIAIIKKQLAWGIIGIICGIIGFVTSPILLGIFGLATIGANIEREMTSTQNRPSQYNPPTQVYTPPPKNYTPPQNPRETKELFISARDFWVDTGIILSKNENFNIRASGQWSNGGDSPKYVGPNGFNITFPGTILGSANLASLIGQVNGRTFSIGQNYSGVSPESGKLLLSINDTQDSFSDNKGNLKVQISHSK